MHRFQRMLHQLRWYAKVVLFSRKIFSPPLRARLLIYDGAGSAHLLRIIPPINPAILFVRGEEWNVSILARAIFRSGSLLDNYEDEYIKTVGPTAIVTWVDNSIRFYLLSNRHPAIKTVFIQNGWRGGVSDVFHNALSDPLIQARVPKVDVMCTFGRAIGREYCKFLKGKSVATGSLLSNEYPVTTKRKIRRIAYISMPIPQDQFARESVETFLKDLFKYSCGRGIPLAIVGRARPSEKGFKEEESYYRELLDWDGEFKEREGQHSSYRFLDESEVSVSIDTSLGYETVARGNKNAFFCIYGKLFNSDQFNFGWPAKYPPIGPFWANDFDQTVLEQVLDHLFAINNEQWLAELAEWAYDDLMTYDSGNMNLRKIVNEIISEY